MKGYSAFKLIDDSGNEMPVVLKIFEKDEDGDRACYLGVSPPRCAEGADGIGFLLHGKEKLIKALGDFT